MDTGPAVVRRSSLPRRSACSSTVPAVFAFGGTKSTSSLIGVVDPGGAGHHRCWTTKPPVPPIQATGWAAGGGAEFAIDANWSIKGEYLYTDLGEEDIFSFNEDGISAGLSSDVKFHTIRIGLNYRVLEVGVRITAKYKFN